MGWSEEDANTELEMYMLWRGTYDPKNEIHQTAQFLIGQAVSNCFDE